MSWLSRVFSNPVKTLGDITSFGFTAFGREVLPKSFGGGQSGFFSKSSEVVGATTIGVGVGFASGGVPGAFVGGASGFGRGVSGVVHGESGKNIAGGAAKWAAITGGVTGIARGATGATMGEKFMSGGAGGIVRSAVVQGAAKVPKLPGITAPKLAGFSTSVAAASQLISSLRPISPGTSSTTVAPPSTPNIDLAPANPSINVGNPTDTPSAAPVIVAAPGAEAKTPWLLIIAAAAVVFYVWKRKRL